MFNKLKSIIKKELTIRQKETGKIPVLSHSSDLLHLDKRGRIMVELEGKGSDLHALFLPRPVPCGLNLSHGMVRVRS